MKARKGSITVMLILVLCAIVMAVTLVVEVARIRIAEGQAKRAVDTALFSSLASYDQDTKDDYGLFYRYGTVGLDKEIEETIGKSLLINDASPVWHPYAFQVTSIDVRVLFPLSDMKSIKHQILEYMKYRGPEKLVGEAVEKLGAFFSMQSTAKVMTADLAVDKKIKRLADQIQALDAVMARVSGYSDTDLQAFNAYAAKVAEKAMQIKEMKKTIDKMNSGGGRSTPEERERIADIQSRIDAMRSEISQAGQSLLMNITPILDANREAILICQELKKLGPGIEEAIDRSDHILDTEKDVINDIRGGLKKKYENYKSYTNIQNLNAMENDLKSNIMLIEPKIVLMKQLMDGGSSGYRPQVFIEAGYKSVSFSPPIYPGSTTKPGGYAVNLNPDVIQKLMNKVKGLIEEVKSSAVVGEEGLILNCPGNQFSASHESIVSSIGDDYNGANDALSSVYDSIGDSLDTGSFLESTAVGTLNLSKNIYEALLVNEYVLSTFNSRGDAGHEKHTMKQTEVEYVLVGSANPQINASVSQLEIISWRTVFNTVSFGYYCPEIIKTIDGASAGLSSLTGVPYPVWKGILTGLLSFVESYADTKRMIEGESIPIFKFKLKETSLVQEFEELTHEFRISISKSEADDQPESHESLKSKSMKVNYEDHLRVMLLYRAMLGQSDTTLCRIQDLIYTNILKTRGEYDPSKHFNFIEVDAQFTIKSFFPNLNGIKASLQGIPMRHTISVECGRGY